MSIDQQNTQDQFLLQRFVDAQEGVYEEALAQIKRGKKAGHWMWFIFPQINGLGSSMTARQYGIKDKQEATAYLDHPVLGKRLLDCCAALLNLQGKSATDIFGYPDDLKLRSCMTLFSTIAASDSPFSQVLEKYYSGIIDTRTLEILSTLK